MQEDIKDPIQNALVSTLKKNIILLQNDNKDKEVATIHRVLLFTPSIRKQLDLHFFLAIIKEYMNESSELKPLLIEHLAPFCEVESEVKPSAITKEIIDMYLGSIAIYKLYIVNDLKGCYSIIQSMIHSFMLDSSIDRQKEYIMNRVYTYLMLLQNQTYPLPHLMKELMHGFRICCLHNKTITGSCLYNCILRVYVSEKQYMSAAAFLHRTAFPTEACDKQLLRYHYYKALVSTVLMDYEEATQCLFTIRKKSGSPQECAFFAAVAKLAILVKLLTGEAPDLLAVPDVRELKPYLQLATVVLKGDLPQYRSVLQKHRTPFAQDGLWCIINRLHNTVTRIALVKISRSYSRISLEEVASILELQNEEEARYTCMRNIRDGIINGTIANDYFITQEEETSALTSRSRELFSKRIAFCLSLKKEIVSKSMN